MPPKCFKVLQPDNPRKLGRFALKAEATRLLGQVIRHVEATDFEDTFHKEEALLLDGALRALVNVTEFEVFTPVRQYERFTNRALRLVNRPSD